MSAAGSSPTSSGDNGESQDDRNELFVAIAALIVSGIAFVVTAFQTLQQFFSSAQGYSSCRDDTIGLWSTFTRRRWPWLQFRLRVFYAVPVIFVAPPNNKSGPLGHTSVKTILYFTGTTESYSAAHVWTPEEFDRRQDKRVKGPDTRETIHTADNELANWLALLMALQRMERESREWQRKMFNRSDRDPYGKLKNPHSLAIAMQEKKRSWDTMPDSLKKPYATTTMCHIIEMLAMLGVYWKDFDRDNDKYRAQGNGFRVTGSMVPTLGVAFTFEKIGKTWFQENRVIPNDNVKMLCFGFCPTIFRENTSAPLYPDEVQDDGIFQLATKPEIGETLTALKCNTSTVGYFRFAKDHMRYSHIFPIPFEMLGMVGELLQIKDTAFTMLPNPTSFAWNKSAFSLLLLVRSFQACLVDAATETHLRHSAHFLWVRGAVDTVVQIADKEKRLKDANDKKLELIRKEDDRKRKEKAAAAANEATRKQNEKAEQAAQAGSWPRVYVRSFLAFLKLVEDPTKAQAQVSGQDHELAVLPQQGQALQPAQGQAAQPAQEQAQDEEPNATKVAKDPYTERPAGERDLAVYVLYRDTFETYLQVLHKAIEECDKILKDAGNRELVEAVFRCHLQEAMAYLNYDIDNPPNWQAPAAGANMSPSAPKRKGSAYARERGTDYHGPDELDEAFVVERPNILAKLYVFFIRKRVVRNAEIPDNAVRQAPAGAGPPLSAAVPDAINAANAAGQNAHGPGPANPPLTPGAAPSPPAEAPDAGIALFASGNDAGPASHAPLSGGRGSGRAHHPFFPRRPGGHDDPANAVGAAVVDPDPGARGPRRPSTLPARLMSRLSNRAGPWPARPGPAAPARQAGQAVDPAEDRVAWVEKIGSLPGTMPSAEEVWFILFFRMMCWLMLHDFHEKDIQVSKSDMYASREAVYLL